MMTTSAAFDPVLLASFVAVAQARSFTEAGRRLGLRQSTVSQHVRRLESAAARRLFVRDTHSVALTPDGDAMLGFAQNILEANARARRYFTGSELRGRVRFGAAEDFVATRLPEVLREFTREHRAVDLELTVGLSGALFQRLDAGRLDLVLAKRRPGDPRGRLVRRERLVWVGLSPALADPTQPLPLILYPAPSIARSVALEALERIDRSWRIVCTSGSHNGLIAAALAGLGVTLLAESAVPDGLAALPTGPALPELGTIEFVVVGGTRALRGPAAALAAAILDNFDRLQT
ncbi:MAG TPA: LysR family transcriptional regulator [Candidatus Sulfotelmatobacter sp.]|nr:LysR family transcriptional regulator [Candidatus Sulfotelmatobacter sp.]